MANKNKEIDTKLLQSYISDFSKLYNLELSDEDSVKSKYEIEKSLKEKITTELAKH